MKKKLLSVVLAASMMLSLAACGDKPADTQSQSTDTQSTTTTTTTTTDSTPAATETTGPDERGMQDGKFVETRHITVEL